LCCLVLVLSPWFVVVEYIGLVVVNLDVAFCESLRDVRFSNDVSLRLLTLLATRLDQTDTRVWKIG
jgi:hypothetical protein